MLEHYGRVFVELIATPFGYADLVWGIVPLYFGWLVNELTSKKASYTTSINTGFSFIWAAAHWIYQWSSGHPRLKAPTDWQHLPAVNWLVAFAVLALGLTALICGLRRKFPKYGSILGHTRFSNYFMIAIFPMQSNYLPWTWDRVIAICLFAAPVWIIVHFGLSPLRKK